MQTANANVDQAIGMEQTAAILKETTQAVEDIDLAGAVDDIQDSARTIKEHDKLLTRPITDAGGRKVQANARAEAESELDRLMRQQEPVLPNVPDKGALVGSIPQETIQKGPIEGKVE